MSDEKCIPKIYNIPQQKWVVVFKVNPSTKKMIYGDTEEEAIKRMNQIKERWQKKYEERALKEFN